MVSSSCYPLHFLLMVVEIIPVTNMIAKAEVFPTRDAIEANISSFVSLQTLLALAFFCPETTQRIPCNIILYQVVCLPIAVS
jgi:hypothetical protein